jgi:hypothetical protein
MKLHVIHESFLGKAAVAIAFIIVFAWYGEASAIIFATDSDNWFHSDLTHRFGHAIAGAGDFNGDGNEDIIVGAYNGSDDEKCEAFIFYGPDPSDPPIDREFERSDANVILKGPSSTLFERSTWFGYSVAGRGNFNDDGYDDIVVGAPFAGSDHQGCAYVYLGREQENDQITIVSSEADITFCGEDAWDMFGWSVALGTHNVYIGAPQLNPAFWGPEGGGAVYIVRQFDPLGTHPVINIDGPFTRGVGALGYSVAVTNGIDGGEGTWLAMGDPFYVSTRGDTVGAVSFHYFSSDEYGFLILGSRQHFGRFGASVASAGDVNLDGYNDIIVGAPGMDSVHGDVNVGYAYIILGRPVIDIYHPEEMWSSDSPGDYPSGVIQLRGQSAYDYFGHSVSTLGDINGDLYEDVIVGAPREYTPDGTLRTGSAYVFAGRAAEEDSFIELQVTLDNLHFTGESGTGYFGNSVAGGLHWTADGTLNALVGAPGNKSVYLFKPYLSDLTIGRVIPFSLQNNTDLFGRMSPLYRTFIDSGTIGFYFMEPGDGSEQKLQFWGEVPFDTTVPPGKSVTLPIPRPTCSQASLNTAMACSQPSNEASLFWTFQATIDGKPLYAFPEDTQDPQEPQMPPLLPLSSDGVNENKFQLIAFGDESAVVGGAKTFNLMPAVASVAINPQVLNLKLNGGRIKCTINLPDGLRERDIEPDSLLISDPSCKECQPIKALRGYATKRKYTAFFSRDDLVSLIKTQQGEHNQLMLRISGHMKFGNLFEGDTAIRV